MELVACAMFLLPALALPIWIFFRSGRDSWRRLSESGRKFNFPLIDLWAAPIALFPSCLVFAGWLQATKHWILLVATIITLTFQLYGMAIAIISINLNGGDARPLSRITSVIGGGWAGALIAGCILGPLALLIHA
jgi:hypothetical protein